MYDYTIEQIKKAIESTNVYFNPRYFTSLLETTYNCNIYTFTPDGITIPRHQQAYYHTSHKDGPCVLIYEHQGNDPNLGETRCELITWNTTKSEVENNFGWGTPLCKNIREIFNEAYKSYILNKEIPETYFPVTLFNLIEQGFDAYGKCRMVRFNFEGVKGTMLTSPMQPLYLPEVDEWNITRIKFSVAEKFVKSTGMSDISYGVINGRVKMLSGHIGNIRVSIPILDRVSDKKTQSKTTENFMFC